MKQFSLTSAAEALVEPVSSAQAKLHARISTTADDTLVAAQIIAAREMVEAFLGRQLITRTWALKLDEFPEVIVLPRPPAQSITSIAYLDTDGDSQTLSSATYQLYESNAVWRVAPAYSESWPSTRPQPDAVTVTYAAGYGDAATDVPPCIVAAIQLVIAGLYELRADQVEQQLHDNKAYGRLLWPYRIMEA